MDKPHPGLSKGEGVIQITYISAWGEVVYKCRWAAREECNGEYIRWAGVLVGHNFVPLHNGYATVDVDCSGWASGMYVVCLETDKEGCRRNLLRNGNIY
ncbi:MAG: hypothetical protein IPO27_08215 [Bacteroidetes bacterium]|nr:hypothetical protein [Bacteroidota bacterium]